LEADSWRVLSGLGLCDGQPFNNPIREGLPTIRSELCLKTPFRANELSE